MVINDQSGMAKEVEDDDGSESLHSHDTDEDEEEGGSLDEQEDEVERGESLSSALLCSLRSAHLSEQNVYDVQKARGSSKRKKLQQRSTRLTETMATMAVTSRALKLPPPCRRMRQSDSD